MCTRRPHVHAPRRRTRRNSTTGSRGRNGSCRGSEAHRDQGSLGDRQALVGILVRKDLRDLIRASGLRWRQGRGLHGLLHRRSLYRRHGGFYRRNGLVLVGIRGIRHEMPPLRKRLQPPCRVRSGRGRVRRPDRFTVSRRVPRCGAAAAGSGSKKDGHAGSAKGDAVPIDVALRD